MTREEGEEEEVEGKSTEAVVAVEGGGGRERDAGGERGHTAPAEKNIPLD